MAEYFHGQNLVLPVGQWRRRAILALKDQGLTGDEIAARLKMSRSYVFDVLAAARARSVTTDLFG
jgi:DNA-binding transcriptional regulator LsrR (DeoR family)